MLAESERDIFQSKKVDGGVFGCGSPKSIVL